MSIWNSIKNIFRENVDKADDALKDSVRDGKYAIEDAEKDIEKFKSQIADLMVQNKQSEKEIDNKKKEIETYERLAKRAAEVGNKEDARKALEKKKQRKQELVALESSYQNSKKIEHNLRSKLEMRRNQVAQAESNFAQLKARKTAADISKQYAGADVGESSFAALDNLANDVERSEYEVEALEDLEGGDDQELLEKYSDDNEDVNDELDALMKNHGHKGIK